MPERELTIRRFRDADAEATALIFFDAVHQGTGDHYTAAERKAWAPAIPGRESWLARLRPQICFVAEREGQVLGFMAMSDAGHLDLAYVAPSAIGQGIGGRLHDAVAEAAADAGLARLTADASIAARGFFEGLGWRVVDRQTEIRDGRRLENFRMERSIERAPSP